MDTIFINDFRLEILIGVYEWERRVPQTVQLDLEFALPARDKRSDRIGDTIDYAKVVARIEESLAHNRFLLVEALAEHIAQIVLTEFQDECRAGSMRCPQWDWARFTKFALPLAQGAGEAICCVLHRLETQLP